MSDETKAAAIDVDVDETAQFGGPIIAFFESIGATTSCASCGASVWALVHGASIVEGTDFGLHTLCCMRCGFIRQHSKLIVEIQMNKQAERAR